MIKSFIYLIAVTITFSVFAADILDSIRDDIMSSDDIFNFDFSDDTIYFLDTETPISIGSKISGGGTKTAYSIMKPSSDWIVFLPNKNFEAKIWLQILEREKWAADKIRTFSRNMAQEFIWVVIVKKDSGKKLLTLAAKSFISLAINDGLFVFDPKTTQHGLFSRFKDGGPYIGGVTEDQFYAANFWNSSISSLTMLLKSGFPQTLTTSDSLNLIVEAEISEPNKKALLSLPINYRDKDKIIMLCQEKDLELKARNCQGYSAADWEDYKEEFELLQRPGIIKRLAEKCYFNMDNPEEAIISCEDIKFKFGNHLSLFVFDIGSLENGCNMIDLTDKNVTDYFTRLIDNFIELSAMVFFPTQIRFHPEFKRKIAILKMDLVDKLRSASVM